MADLPFALYLPVLLIYLKREGGRRVACCSDFSVLLPSSVLISSLALLVFIILNFSITSFIYLASTPPQAFW
jgi:hypothetical protein